MSPVVAALVMAATFLSFAVSASAGLGGSLVLVPTLVAVVGTKEGVALAALLLAANNVVKVIAYRDRLPFRAALPIIVLVAIGAFIGSVLLVAAPESVVAAAVIVMLGASFLLERSRWSSKPAAPALALASGGTSGFSGTSGPLKGMALRSLELDRRHLVGAASLASLVGDATKSAVFTEAGLLGPTAVKVAVASIPLMIAGTLLGRSVNQRLGEQGYATLFWLVMAGYVARLAFL